jgi:hypothetical protein
MNENSLTKLFEANVNKRTLLMTPSYPYIFIGEIKKVLQDSVVIKVETTHIEQLENRDWHISIEEIETFYIEEEDRPIPNLKT